MQAQKENIKKLKEFLKRQEEVRENLTASIGQLPRRMRSLEGALTQINGFIAETDDRIQSSENTSYNGRFVFRISDFDSARQEARTGRVPCRDSCPFFTSQHGE